MENEICLQCSGTESVIKPKEAHQNGSSYIFNLTLDCDCAVEKIAEMDIHSAKFLRMI
jgi:hypothetical protein